MLGEQIGETKGKRLLRRVLSNEPLTAEVSFEESGNLLGVAYSGFGTYTAEARPDGTVYGEGQGVAMTVDGEAVTWKGSGLGKLGAGGAISYRGILYFRTSAQKLARLNSAPGVFEYEVDAAGNTTNKIWEWK